MNQLVVYKERTILVTYQWDKILINIPRSKVEEIMADEDIDTIKIAEQDKIKKAGISRRYAYNLTDEMEAWILEEHPNHVEAIKREIKRREKEWLPVRKEIINNFLQSKWLING